MANIFSLLLTSTSIIIGVLVIIASSLVIDQYRNGIDQCFEKNYPGWMLISDAARNTICEPFYALTGVSTCGILAGVVQILFSLGTMVQRYNVGRPWVGGHALVFVLTIVGFALGIHYFGDEKQKYNVLYNLFRDAHKTRYLIAICGIDWIFSFLALILANCIPDNGHRYAKPSGA